MYKEIDSNKRKTFVFVTLFLVFIIALGWIFGRAFEIPWLLPAAVAFSIAQSLIAYYYSDQITLAISGAKEAKKGEYLTLHRLVENLAITAGLPKPRIYVIDDTAPNAFATGRDPKHAVVCVTTGILQKLSKVELEGVISHEFSHIGNYDIRLSTIIVVLVGIIALMSDWFLRFSWRRDNREGGQFGTILMVAGIVLAIMSPVIATMIQLAISRKREFLADATGALLTRYPEGLASALEKISSDTEPLEAANKATAHLYIISPFRANIKDGFHVGGWFAGLFSTHPPIGERVKRLRGMISK